ncbi:MAG: energy-coupling factor transporter transmembrane protein EcfT [Desulfobacterales bacterium]|nr:energy-coupling factor transporter transmembrane protein EcfT [Desulfobacterales bacterium]
MVTPFTYQSGASIFHRLDVRFKSMLVCILSLAMLQTGLSGGLIWMVLLCLALKSTGRPVLATLLYLKWFALFLLILWGFHAVGRPGTPVANLLDLPLTREGIFSGGVAALRFFILMVVGLLFSSTTKPAQVKSAAQWFLAPIPGVPEKRVAVMISLALGFLPLILKQLEETRNALDARCANLQRNPIKRTVNLCFPLLKKTFAAVDHLVLAMESRCYSEDRTDPDFSDSGMEWPLFLGITALAISLAFLP